MEQRFETARERSNGFFIGAICALAIATLAFCAALFVPQHNAYAVTDGWEQWGTCEWQIDDEGTLTIRPVDDGETGTLGQDGSPWRDVDYETRASVTKFCIAKPISSGSNGCAYLFAGLENLETIIGMNMLDTSEAVTMVEMFNGCKSIASLDLSPLNTSNVADMSYMFWHCSSLTTLNLSNFDTSKVETVQAMFADCSMLPSINLSSFQTSNIKEMGAMFDGCTHLQSLDLSNFDTSNVTSMGGMFRNTALASIDISNFDTSKVTNMSFMFCDNPFLSSLTFGTEFKTSNVETMYYMFANCPQFESIDTSHFDTSKVENMACMFQGCSSLESLNLLSFETGEVTSMADMFALCSSLSTLDLSSFDTSNVTDMYQMFNGCSSLSKLDVGSFDTSKVVDMRYMFSGCSNLKMLDVSRFVTSSAKKMDYMFLDCSALTSLDLSSFNTENVESMNSMMSGCSSLAAITIPDQLIGPYCTNIGGMFSGCNSLTTIPDNFSFGQNADLLTKKAGIFYYAESPDLVTYYSGNDPSVLTYNWAEDNRQLELQVPSISGEAIVTGNPCEGMALKIVVQLDAACSDAQLLYQWFDAADDSAVTEATNSTEFAIPEGSEGKSFYCVVTDGSGTYGSSLKSNAVTARHSFGEWATTTEPTCTEEGEETRTCEKCDATETRPVDAKGHTAGEAWESDATDHWHICTECGTELDSEAHKFGEWITTVEPAEDIAGERERTCEVCNYVETAEIPATGHTADETWHSDESSHWHVCTGCGEEIEKSAHEYGEWTTTLEPTCTEDGTKARACTVCGYEQTETIPSSGHSFGEWKVTTEPTCMDEGEETRTCANCDATETRPVAATGQHVYADWTSDENGHRHVCETCGLVTDDAAHEFSEWVTTVEPTCTEDGSQTRACATCGYEETAVIPAAGHSFGDWEIISDATETQDGSKKHVCEVCGFEETVTIPATGSQQGGQDDDQQGSQDDNKGDSDQQGEQTDNTQGDSSNASGDPADGSNALAQTGDATPIAPIAFGALATLAVAGIAMRKLRA